MPAVSAERQPTGTAFALRDPLPWGDLATIVRAAEQAGFVALFLPEITGRDAFVTLGALAGETRDLLLGTGVVPMRSRTLLLTAMAATTLQERSGGRLILGLGTGGVGTGALEELRTRVLATRQLLEGGTVEHEGGRLRLSLEIDTPAPIWISALGPRAMRLAGEVADGVILNWCTPERVAFARERIREGAERAGRDPSFVTLSVYIRAWVGDDVEEAMPALRAATAQYAAYPAYARQFQQMGFGPEAAAAVGALRAGRPEAVSDGFVRALCAFGDGAARHLRAYADAGADLAVVYPVAVGEAARSVQRTLFALAPEVVD